MITKMRKNIYAILFVASIICSTGCEKDKYLQDGSITSGNDVNEQQFWANPDFARNFLNNVYSHVTDRYNLEDGGAILASASDEAVNSNLNSSINVLNNGTWSPVRTFDDVYNNMYQGIRKANMFLENASTSAIIPAAELRTNTPADLTFEAQIERLKGQAYFLRALFEFELVKRYGRMVIVTRTLTVSEELNLPRNTFDECVAQIVKDCDEAILRLPQSSGTAPGDWADAQRGRATQTAAMALKARILLYAASPQYNTTNDAAKWQTAADAAKRLIDLNRHGLHTSYPNIWLWNVTANAYNTEVIFATAANNINSIEINNAPISYDGALGRTNPTQELVDAFEMRTTGKPIAEAGSGYNAAAPYVNRDPRLGFAVMFNGSTFKSRSVDTFVGGKDGLGSNVNATKTGYYMRKFLSESAVWNTGANTSIRRPWILFRYAEVLLNYAEALNEAQGPAALTEILRVVNLVRARGGVAMPALQTTNPAGNGYVAATKDELRKRIRNERRIELCFEEHRFYDVRRWKEGEITFNKPVTGMRITQTAPSVFTYTPFTIESRVFTAKNYLYPVSQNELNRAPALLQNTGY